MPRTPLHAIIWSREQQCYELYTQSQLQQRFHLADEAIWLSWLRQGASFAFRGASGRLNVYQESRPRGGSYWYAYHMVGRRTHKRYLGTTERVSLTRLEEAAQALAGGPALPTPATLPLLSAEPPPLLGAKLVSPRLPHSLVERPRLLAILDRALSPPLTLLSAPAGWGKTTVLSAWANQHKARIAWLSLDELDNTPLRFWASLLAALRHCSGMETVGETTLALLQSPQPPPLLTCLAVLIQELENQAAHLAPVVLILDDYQVISDPELHQTLTFWIEHLPAHVHLILSSRVDPDLPLARLRARGQLIEIRATDLRFRPEEVDTFLRQGMRLALAEEDVVLLDRRTEGWIAGLQLAALALQQHEDRAAFLQALTGGQRYLLDYIQEDILARLPEAVRTFLCQTAVLSRLEAAACQAVTAEPDRQACQQMLLFLERSNLFLVPLDEERRWYHLHDLFREALLALLAATQPDMLPLLHQRAARFYEAQGEWHEALAHFFAAADFSTAARLMEQTVEQSWVHGEIASIAHWIKALPHALVRQHARLLLTTSLYLLNTVSQAPWEQRVPVHQQVRQIMARVASALRQQENATTGAEAETALASQERSARAAKETVPRRRLRLLQAYLVLNEALAAADYQHIVRVQQEIGKLEPDEEILWQMIPLTALFLLHFTVRQEGGKLLPHLLEAKRQADASGNRYASIKVRHWLALVAPEAGRLHLAFQESQEALALIDQMEGYAPLKGYLEMVRVEVLFHWNRLQEARALLETLLPVALSWQQSDVLGWGYGCLVQLELARGDLPAAQQALSRMEDLVAQKRLLHYRNWLPALRAQCWLALGQVQAAADWAASVLFPEGPWDHSLYRTFEVMIQVYFAKLRWTEAAELLDRWRGHLDRPTAVPITITFLAQSLVALHQTGQKEQARSLAARLVALTEPEGFLRGYLNEGTLMKQVLESLLADSRDQATDCLADTRFFLSYLVSLFEQEEQAPNPSRGGAFPLEPVLSSAPSLVSLQPDSSVARMPVASLTRREQDVLRLLATGASNQDIARALVIELSTVKKHVSNLLGKLEATGRSQAVARARALSLL